VVEFFREPDYHLGFILGPFSMGQLLSAPMVLLGAFMIALGYQRAGKTAGQ
jgi:phosphatidylglycerol:prolipoprotein diacylglycerol transferase